MSKTATKGYRTPTQKKLDAADVKAEADAQALRECADSLGWETEDIDILSKHIAARLQSQKRRLAENLCGLEMKKHWQGRTVYFDPLNQFVMNLATVGKDFDNLDGATTAKFYAYQPRANRVWLQFSPADLKNPQYKNHLLPFQLCEIVKMNLTTTPPEKATN